MKTYLAKTPNWFEKVYPNRIWRFSDSDKNIYLTFDDGPTPEITPWVLDCLKDYNAKATFFCIGKNIAAHPIIYKRIKDEGHAIGNHTYEHLNGWKSNNEVYLESIAQTRHLMPDSTLFRPPYGRVKSSQSKLLFANGYQVVMWSVLSGDFDPAINADQCVKNVIENGKNGDIIVFHDSQKAYGKLSVVLPKILTHYKELDYQFNAIQN